MKHLWAISCARVTLLSACLAPAWAAEPATAEPAAAQPAAQPGAAPDATAAGFEAALRDADRRFVAGDLEGAWRVLQPVCAGSERPECAFNLAAIQHGLGHCAAARGYYRRYLELSPHGDRVAEARDALEEVEARCGGSAEASSSPGQPAPAPALAALAGASSAYTSSAYTSSAYTMVPPSSSELPAPSAATALAASRPETPSSSLSADLAVGSFALAGVAALSSIAFGVLAAHDASRCSQAQTYDREFIERCENAGPRYQGLWQGFALASGSFLGIGLALWAFDPGPAATLASGPSPQLGYRGRF